jgi:hypothetical protein
MTSALLLGSKITKQSVYKSRGTSNSRPISFFMSACETSDYIGAAALLNSLPPEQWLLADRGYDAYWFREGLQNKGIKPCVPGRKSRTKPVKYDKR